ncbi:MAG: type I secretion system permease/ATPase [Venatoribacter sp.]
MNENTTQSHDPLLQSFLVLCRFHGQRVHPDALLSGLPLVQGRLTPNLFARAAQRARFGTNAVRKPILELNQALFPAILLLKDNQACVIHSIDKNNEARVTFPELPNSEFQICLTDLNERYAGFCLYARPEQQSTPQSDNPFSTAQNGHWFWAVIKQNYALYKDIVLAAIVINLMAIAMPMFVMNVYDRVVPNNAFSTLWMLTIGMFILLGADLALKLLRNWFVDLAASRADVRLSSRLLDHTLAISLQHQTASSGSLISNLQSFEAVRSFISSLTLAALADLPFLILFIVIILLISWPLAIPIFLGSAAILIYAFISQKNLRELANENMQMSGERNSLLVEGLSNLETVKSFNLQGRVQSVWEKNTIALSHNAAKMRLLSTGVSQGAAWVQQLTGISIIIIGVYQISQGDLSQGGLIAAYLLSSRALVPVSQAAGLLSQYHQAATAMDTLEKMMNTPSEQPEVDKKINRPVLRGDIEFKNVSFAYPNSESLALSQINLKIKAGERVAILGKNGSGKSTLEKLILGLYQPKEGSIFVDDVDIRQLDNTQLRNNLGYVPQDVSLINGSLKDNVAPQTSGHSDQRILQMLQQVGLTSMIHAHPQGIAMRVGERGAHLSGGQRQAVALARALINAPNILVLDEPTSSLDYTNEEIIKKVLAKHALKKTLILITHRSPLLALVDRLVVVDQGRIVADGPKETVMEALRQGRITGAN